MKVAGRIALSCFLSLALAPVPQAADAEQAALALKVQVVLKTHCYRCHGREGANEGGFTYGDWNHPLAFRN